MRVHIASDHAAFDLHNTLVTFCQEEGHEVTNHGAFTLDNEDDYPVFILRAAEAVAADPGSFGIVLGGSGNGEQMAANKVAGIRAALCYNTELAQLAREHNDAQIISLGGRMNTEEEAKEMVRVFLSTKFSGAERHQRRIDQVSAYETSGELPAFPAQDS